MKLAPLINHNHSPKENAIENSLLRNMLSKKCTNALI